MRFFWRKAPIVAFAAAVLGGAAPASATPGTAFSSTFQNTSSVTTSFRQADGNTFIGQTVQAVYAGDLWGPVVEYIDIVIHPDGSLNAEGEDVCTCTLAGTGTVGNDRAGVLRDRGRHGVRQRTVRVHWRDWRPGRHARRRDVRSERLEWPVLGLLPLRAVAARRRQSRLERGGGGQARPPSPREPLPCL